MRFCLLLLLIPCLQAQPHWPRFEQFPATETFTGKPAAPILKPVGNPHLRTRIREGTAKGPNFAGHYTIVELDCGSGCVFIVVVDARTGQISLSPFGMLGNGTGLKFADGTSAQTVGFQKLSYALDSRLLIARGCILAPRDVVALTPDCGAYYYEWTGSKFKLLVKGAGVVDTK